LSIALFAVGAQTPPEQVMFVVAAEEIVTAACACVAEIRAAATAKHPERQRIVITPKLTPS
jgi:hypothetical protein